jgi:hypothetical protein
VHLEQLVVDVHGPRPGEGLVEHVEVGAQGGRGPLVGQPEHLADDPVV